MSQGLEGRLEVNIGDRIRMWSILSAGDESEYIIAEEGRRFGCFVGGYVADLSYNKVWLSREHPDRHTKAFDVDCIPAARRYHSTGYMLSYFSRYASQTDQSFGEKWLDLEMVGKQGLKGQPLHLKIGDLVRLWQEDKNKKTINHEAMGFVTRIDNIYIRLALEHPGLPAGQNATAGFFGHRSRPVKYYLSSFNRYAIQLDLNQKNE